MIFRHSPHGSHLLRGLQIRPTAGYCIADAIITCFSPSSRHTSHISAGGWVQPPLEVCEPRTDRPDSPLRKGRAQGTSHSLQATLIIFSSSPWPLFRHVPALLLHLLLRPNYKKASLTVFHNEHLHNVYCSPSIIRMINPRTTRWDAM
jgi:hypothetical protein